MFFFDIFGANSSSFQKNEKPKRLTYGVFEATKPKRLTYGVFEATKPKRHSFERFEKDFCKKNHFEAVIVNVDECPASVTEKGKGYSKRCKTVYIVSNDVELNAMRAHTANLKKRPLLNLDAGTNVPLVDFQIDTDESLADDTIKLSSDTINVGSCLESAMEQFGDNLTTSDPEGK
ncbi:hypothetical protein [Gimesia fumaroli]|uniref:Uncharacterized protein n=1 Tax=Gimesia fumaroli TaxID=2527976 RepID=A0A518IKU7_9PLAN|nr:hypothetical protein [Gimesia fumaroli]QDV53685.1 hypothetical protein Enr17x_57660 [Gimesia fumaroli]